MKNKFLTFAMELKTVDEDGPEGIIEGYASTFGNMDQGFDIVEKGAFKKTLRDTKGRVPVLADHDPYNQIGWGIEGKEDDTGLAVKAVLDIRNNAKAMEKFSLAKKAKEIKAKMGLSIGYRTIKDERDTNNPNVRILKELKLYEYSLTAFPMNTLANVTDAKSFLLATDSVEMAVKKFVLEMAEFGHTEDLIRKTLARAVTGETEPNPLVHSFVESVEKLKQEFFGHSK